MLCYDAHAVYVIATQEAKLLCYLRYLAVMSYPASLLAWLSVTLSPHKSLCIILSFESLEIGHGCYAKGCTPAPCLLWVSLGCKSELVFIYGIA